MRVKFVNKKAISPHCTIRHLGLETVGRSIFRFLYYSAMNEIQKAKLQESSKDQSKKDIKSKKSVQKLEIGNSN